MFSSWPVSALVAGLKIGASSFSLSTQTVRQLLAGERAGCGILLPGRAGDVAADHAFDRKHGGAPAQHRAPESVGAMILQRGHLAR